MKKVTAKVSIYDEKSKQKALQALSELKGIESLSADKDTGKITVIGDIDPVAVVEKLRNKKCSASLESAGPKEEKKEEKKGKTPEEKKKEEEEEKKKKEYLEAISKHYQIMHPNGTQHYYAQSMEEDPNACVIF